MVNVNIETLIAEHYQEFKTMLDLMEKIYTPPIIEPTQDIPTIFYNAGRYSVLLHFKAKMAEVEERMNLNVLGE